MPEVTTQTPEAGDFSGSPGLFIVLPVNKDGLSFERDSQLCASTLLMDGYAAHLLCEFPDGCHLTAAPGYRLKNPKDFLAKYGNHVVAVLRLLSHMTESSVTSQHAAAARAVTRNTDAILRDLESKFGVSDSTSAQTQTAELLNSINTARKDFRREHLRNFLHVVDTPSTFGPLRRTKFGGERLWLCEDHHKLLIAANIETNSTQESIV